MAVGVSNAQTDSTRSARPDSTKSMRMDSTKSMKPMMMSDSSKTAKTFGGLGQYNTFSIGVNAGITSAVVPFTSNSTDRVKVSIGYGATIRQQFSHFFSLQLDYYGGQVTGSNVGTQYNPEDAYKFGNTGFITKFNSASLSGVFSVGSVSFLHRKNGVNFYASVGAGIDFYKPQFVYPYDPASGTSTKIVAPYNHTVKELAAPVGVGVKFRLTDALALNIGYTATFVNGYNFQGYSSFPFKDHYGYGYGGLEYTFGPSSKPNIEWANPVAMMYDELYDAALRQEVEALKGRVANVETAVSDLKKDSDGDGVSDQFDKCPNTPAGTVVDGSGCPIVFPKPDSTAKGGAAMAPATAYGAIQFVFDSSVLKTSSYPILDATSADLKSSGSAAELDGYASSEGTAAYNMRLSKDRANSVKTYLVNSGVEARKLKVKAYGETHPIADNSTEEGRVLNRRVEFKKK